MSRLTERLVKAHASPVTSTDFDLPASRDWAHHIAGSSEEHGNLGPETFSATTPLGDYQGVTEQVPMSLTPGRYDPVLVPRASCKAEWLRRNAD